MSASGVFEDGLDGGTSDVLATERAKASFSPEVMAAFLAGGAAFVVRTRKPSPIAILHVVLL